MLSPPTKRGNFNFDQSTSKVREDNASSFKLQENISSSPYNNKSDGTSVVHRKESSSSDDSKKDSRSAEKDQVSVDKIHLSFDKSNSAEGAVTKESKPSSSSANSTGSPKTTKHLDITSSSLLLTRLSPVLPRSNAVGKASSSAPHILSGNLPIKPVQSSYPFYSPESENDTSNKDCVLSSGAIANGSETVRKVSDIRKQDMEREFPILGLPEEGKLLKSSKGNLHKEGDPVPTSTELQKLNSAAPLVQVDNNKEHLKTEDLSVQSAYPEAPKCVTLAETLPSSAVCLPSPSVVGEQGSSGAIPSVFSPTVSSVEVTSTTAAVQNRSAIGVLQSSQTSTSPSSEAKPSVFSTTVSSAVATSATGAVQPSQRGKMATRTAPQTSKSTLHIDPARAAKGPSGIVMGRSAIMPHRAGQRGAMGNKKTAVQNTSSKSEVSSSGATPKSSNKTSVTDGAARKSFKASETSSLSKASPQISKPSSTNPPQGATKKKLTVPTTQPVTGISCATCGRRKSTGRALPEGLPLVVGSQPRRGSADDLLRVSVTDVKASSSSSKGEGGKKYHEQCQPSKPSSKSGQRRERTPRFV